MLTPINLRRFKRFAMESLYYQLFEFIARDFMGKDDCRNIHLPGNIIAPPSGGPTTQIIPGGSSTVIDAKKPVYEARSRLGDIQVNVAEETGEFTG